MPGTKYRIDNGRVVGVEQEAAPPPESPPEVKPDPATLPNSEKTEQAPAPLATPSGYAETAQEQIAAAVNGLAAGAFSLYVKTKNFHWHVAGPHFRDYHLLFDEQAGQILDSIDELAERVRKIGQPTIHSLSEIEKLSNIECDDDPLVAPAQMITRLLADNQSMAKDQRAAIELCDKLGDSATSNILQTLLDQTERRVWFLFEISQGGQ